jgi:hypothetical protein
MKFSGYVCLLYLMFDKSYRRQFQRLVRRDANTADILITILVFVNLAFFYFFVIFYAL